MGQLTINQVLDHLLTNTKVDQINSNMEVADQRLNNLIKALKELQSIYNELINLKSTHGGRCMIEKGKEKVCKIDKVLLSLQTSNKK